MYPEAVWIKKTASYFGNLGMTLFFILSGFVITYNYSSSILDKGGVKTFLIARIARLFPLYLLFIVFISVVNLMFLNIEPSSAYASLVPMNLMAVQSWFYGEVLGVYWHSSLVYGNVAWSISTEVFLYLVFVPLSLIFFRGDKCGYILSFLFIAFLILIRVLMINVDLPPSEHFWLNFISPYGRMSEFMIGVFLCHIYWNLNNSITKRIQLTLCILLFAFGTFLILYYNDTSSTYVSSIFISMASIIGLSLLPSSDDLKPLSFQYWLHGLGLISYSVYLIHAILFPVFRYLQMNGLLGFAIFLLILMCLSYMSYRFIERPAQKFILRSLSSKM